MAYCAFETLINIEKTGAGNDVLLEEYQTFQDKRSILLLTFDPLVTIT